MKVMMVLTLVSAVSNGCDRCGYGSRICMSEKDLRHSAKKWGEILHVPRYSEERVSTKLTDRTIHNRYSLSPRIGGLP